MCAFYDWIPVRCLPSHAERERERERERLQLKQTEAAAAVMHSLPLLSSTLCTGKPSSTSNFVRCRASQIIVTPLHGWGFGKSVIQTECHLTDDFQYSHSGTRNSAVQISVREGV